FADPPPPPPALLGLAEPLGIPLDFFGSGRYDPMSAEGLLDFEIWKHQADKLGITLTKDDVRKIVQFDAAGQDRLPKGPWKNDKDLAVVFAKEGTASFTEDELITAIADEYRVVLAQEALFGRAGGVRGVSPAPSAGADPATPYDFWQYFKAHRT